MQTNTVRYAMQAALFSALHLSALEPVVPNPSYAEKPQAISLARNNKAPNPFATPEGIINDLNSVQEYITKTFNQLLRDFKASATPTVNPIVSNEMLKQFTTLKQALRDLPNVIPSSAPQHHTLELIDDLTAAALSIINAIQTIDGNLQAYFDAFPDSEAYKQILDDSIKKLQNAEKEATSIYNFKKFADLRTVTSAAGIVMNIAKTAREKTVQLLDMVKMPKKKSKNPFKRIFGK